MVFFLLRHYVLIIDKFCDAHHILLYNIAYHADFMKPLVTRHQQFVGFSVVFHRLGSPNQEKAGSILPVMSNKSFVQSVHRFSTACAAPTP